MASDVESGIVSSTSVLKDIFHRTSVLGGFPEEVLETLRQASRTVHYNPEDKILSQGELNTNLFFLMLGTVDIYVDGGLVATMKRKGDLLGEMSVITQKPSAATVIAQTPVQLLKVDTDAFKELVGENRDQFEYILYRIYALILTDKLHITNQKAKRLEGTLNALEKAKVELQQINKTMEKRVAERTAGLKNRMEDLLNNHMQPLQSSMRKLLPSVPKENQEEFRGSLEEVGGVIRVLEPITTSFSTELSIKNKKVLIADSEKKQQVTAKMALGGTGVKLTVCSTPEEANQLLNDDKFDIVLADKTNLGVLLNARDKNPKTKVVFATSETIMDYLPSLQEANMMPNIVTRDDGDRALTIKNIMTTVSKLAAGNAFGIERYLNWGVDIQEKKIVRSDEREQLREGMMEYFLGLGVRRSIIDNIGVVADELLMNAIFDAAVDEQGRPMYNSLARTELVELKPNQEGLFRYATDGTYAAVSVEDPFGRLDAETVLKYLESCYSGKAGSLNEDKGGAGRGLHQIIENSTLVVFNVKPGKRTEVVALFHIVPGDKRERLPQFHYFTA